MILVAQLAVARRENQKPSHGLDVGARALVRYSSLAASVESSRGLLHVWDPAGAVRARQLMGLSGAALRTRRLEKSGLPITLGPGGVKSFGRGNL